MIKFLSEEVRTQFHLLPVDEQQEWERVAREFLSAGQTIKFLWIEQVLPGRSEIAIRIDKEFDVT